MVLRGDIDRDQWFTPVWAAEALIRSKFSDLGSSDVVLEPTAGAGAFLCALPPEVEAFGVELDPELAAIGEQRSGRRIIVGDIRTVELPLAPTAIVGNPPFDLEVIDVILDRAHDLLPVDGRVGLILPTYAFQSARRVVKYAQRWSLEQEMLPRNLFPGISKPICFATFHKDGTGTLRGFSLYRELHDVGKAPKWVATELAVGKAPWKRVVLEALRHLGGEASLEAIYDTIAPKRPTDNRWWREKVRQTLGHCGEFVSLGGARWSIA